MPVLINNETIWVECVPGGGQQQQQPQQVHSVHDQDGGIMMELDSGGGDCMDLNKPQAKQ